MATKTIWLYWHQGWGRAPDLVRRCRDSWVRLNPGYRVHALDGRGLSRLVDPPRGIDLGRPDITIQKVSVFARLALLSKHGGAWADATVMCARPLDEWLDRYRGPGLFAFRYPGPDRMLSSWFMAAEPDSVILQRLCRDFSRLFADNHFQNQHTAVGRWLLARLEPRWKSDVRDTVKWHSWTVRKILRVYPYFIFHYTFNRLILTDPECAGLWNAGETLSAEPPHRVQYLADVRDGLEKARSEIDAGSAPMHKLSWRVDSTLAFWTGVLSHLERRR